MKLPIKVQYINNNCHIEINPKGDWIDLRAAKDIVIKCPQAGILQRRRENGVDISYRNVNFESTLIPLGIAVQLPKGFEAVILPRSSAFKNSHIIMANSQGVIDNSYCGEEDEWKFNAIALSHSYIGKGDRICQFRIQLSQKATMWQKIKWLLSSGIKIVEVQKLNNKSRGGFGITGVN